MIKHDPKPLIEFFNAALHSDYDAIAALVNHRVPCNKSMVEHPTIQVRKPEEKGKHTLGLLGLLNGYCGTIEEGPKKGWCPICTVIDDETDEILRFALVADAARNP